MPMRSATKSHQSNSRVTVMVCKIWMLTETPAAPVIQTIQGVVAHAIVMHTVRTRNALMCAKKLTASFKRG